MAVGGVAYAERRMAVGGRGLCGEAERGGCEARMESEAGSPGEAAGAGQAAGASGRGEVWPGAAERGPAVGCAQNPAGRPP